MSIDAFGFPGSPVRPGWQNLLFTNPARPIQQRVTERLEPLLHTSSNPGDTFPSGTLILSALVPPLPPGSIIRLMVGSSLTGTDTFGFGILTDPGVAGASITLGTISGPGLAILQGVVRSRREITCNAFWQAGSNRTNVTTADFGRSNYLGLIYNANSGAGATVVDSATLEVFSKRVYGL